LDGRLKLERTALPSMGREMTRPRGVPAPLLEASSGSRDVLLAMPEPMKRGSV
jgi:hypothetical protein